MFSSLEDICGLIQFVSRKLFMHINAQYQAKIAADLILDEELEKNGKLKKLKKKKKIAK